MDDDFPVTIELAMTLRQGGQGDERASDDPANLKLLWIAHVEDEQTRLLAVEAFFSSSTVMSPLPASFFFRGGSPRMPQNCS